MWAGGRPDIPKVHDSPAKREALSSIEIFHLPSGRWTTQLTTGTPHQGVNGYSCATINSTNIIYFAGYCGHDNCFYNSLTLLDTLTMKWSPLQTTDESAVMKRGYGGLIPVKCDSVQHLFTIGGKGTAPTTYHPQFQYIHVPVADRVYTNEQLLFNMSTSKSPFIVTTCQSV